MPLANNEQLPFEQLRRRLIAPRDDRLTDDRLHVAGRTSNAGVFDRHVAPAEKFLTFIGTDGFQSALAIAALIFDRWQKYIADAVIAASG